ncbi:MAG: ExeM/NucH family extracellular endonuclease [Chloroflexota bacterium]
MRKSLSSLLPALLALALLSSLLMFSGGAQAAGTISLTAFDVAVTENFDTLASSSTSSTVPTGWWFLETGTNKNTLYTAGTGSGTSGDTYSFGAASISERAFGGLLSGSLTPTIGAQFTNNTGGTINVLRISYNGERWRLGAINRDDRLDFQLSTNATSLDTGAWTDYNALDYSVTGLPSGTGALNGNTNRTAVSYTITGLSIANGASFWIRWNDFNASGSDDGLAIDDFSLTPMNAMTIDDVTKIEGDSGVTTFTFNVTLSKAPVVTPVTFDIATQDNTATAADNDYVAKSLVGQSIPVGQNSYTFGVTVNGDTKIEPDEAFTVTLSNVTNALLIDGSGKGAILSEDVVLTAIHDVQGSGDQSSLVDQELSVRGIVVGDFQADPMNLSGFYLQEEDDEADTDSDTSEGIFIYSTLKDVAVGDEVLVTGVVKEYSSTSNGLTSYLTQLASVTKSLVISSSNTLPDVTPLNLPFGSQAEAEAHEGMRVSFAQTLTVNDTYTLSRYGEVMLASQRLDNPTHVAEPGAAAQAVSAQNKLSRFVLDDGSSASNPAAVIYPPPGLSASNTLRVGYTTSNISGIFDERFGVYRVQPILGEPLPTFTASNPRPAAPAAVGGNLKVGGFNMLNYFVTLGSGANCGPTGGLDCRGAANATEFTRQRAKLISAIVAIDPDIAGLMEIENSATDAAVIDLVNGLNAATAPGVYSYIATGPVGTDAIRLGVIYKPAVVTPTGAFKVISSTDYPDFLTTKNRPSLAQTFTHNATQAKLTLVVNHLKSKGSDCNDLSDPDLGDGQGNCNQTRTKAANSVTQWLATDPTGSLDPDFIIVGDMNAYAKEDPIKAFITAGYTNLVDSLLHGEGYSYVFGGETGYLDHALGSASLVPLVTGVTEWHINADEPVALDYDMDYKNDTQDALFYAPDAYRASDHDPVIVGMQLVAPDATDTTLDAGSEPFMIGAPLQITAGILPSPDGGKVTFQLDGVDIPGCVDVPVDSSGEAACSTQVAAAGLHKLTADFSGYGDFLPSSDELQYTSVDQALVYQMDGAPGSEWNSPLVSTTPLSGNSFLGEFGSQEAILTLNKLPFHAQVEVAFDLYIIRSWNGNATFAPARPAALPNGEFDHPDIWRFTANGRTLVDTTFSNYTDGLLWQAFPGSFPGGSFPAQTGALRTNSLGYYSGKAPMDSVYRMKFHLADGQPSLVLNFAALGLQELENESWGLDNLTIRVFSPPYSILLPVIMR